jgi:hypothetical protein
MLRSAGTFVNRVYSSSRWGTLFIPFVEVGNGGGIGGVLSSLTVPCPAAQLLKYLDYTYPMKGDVKKKFSPLPSRETRAW